MKQFNLKENRDKLFKSAKKFSANIDEESSIIAIFKFIHNQDKEFIRLLKDALKYGLKHDGNKIYKNEWKIIDKLSGGL